MNTVVSCPVCGASQQTTQQEPLVYHQVAADFGVFTALPANRLNLHQYVVRHASSTFFAQLENKNRPKQQSVLVIDRSLTPQHGHYVVAIEHGQLCLRQFYLENGRPVFRPLGFKGNKTPYCYTPSVFEVWGVVTYYLRDLR